MKQLYLIIITLLVGSLGLSAQDKFDSAEDELEAITDSVTNEKKTDDLSPEKEYKSTRIESDDQKEKQQKDEDWDDWDDWRSKSENKWKSDKRRGYFRGGAGGWDFYLMDLNVGAINIKLAEIGLNPFDEQIFMSGGGGWGFVGHGIRIGGMGAHGRVKSIGSPGNMNITKEVTLSLNFGGFMIEKVYHPLNKTELYFGTMIGGGNAHLKFEQWGGSIEWNDLWSGYNNDSLAVNYPYTDYQNELSCRYLTILPTIGFRYNFFRWAAVGMNVGYLYSRMNQDGWRKDGKTVAGVPDIDFSNVIYRLNFYFGG